MDWKFELVNEPLGSTTDGPAWDGEALLFTHVQGKEFLRYDPECRVLRYDPQSGGVTEVRRWTNRTKGLAFAPNGTLYGCQSGSRRVVCFNSDGSMSNRADRLEGHLHNHPDDLAVDSQGRVWFSDPYDHLPAMGPQTQGPLDHASVLRLERPHREWTIRRMTYDSTAPSAVLLSKDESTLYVSENSLEDGGKRELRAYAIGEDGALGPYTVLLTFGTDFRGVHRGVDGMCLDTEGNIIACAGWEHSGPGPAIYVISPSGHVLESHPVPADCPTNCTFGDPDLRSLYITTDGGHLYRVRETGHQGWLLFPPAR